jgi:hypothetical protein
MAVSLGPMPAQLREDVARWIDEGRHRDPSSIEAAINARFLVGGPGGSSYLDAEGEVWDLFMDEKSFVRAEDGPRKVSMIVDALKRFPALAIWLPVRPPSAATCDLCAGTGKAPAIFPKISQCWECVGLGWVTEG